MSTWVISSEVGHFLLQMNVQKQCLDSLMIMLLDPKSWCLFSFFLQNYSYFLSLLHFKSNTFYMYFSFYFKKKSLSLFMDPFSEVEEVMKGAAPVTSLLRRDLRGLLLVILLLFPTHKPSSLCSSPVVLTLNLPSVTPSVTTPPDIKVEYLSDPISVPPLSFTFKAILPLLLLPVSLLFQPYMFPMLQTSLF